MLRLVFVVGMMLEVVSSVSAQTNRTNLIQYLECLRLPQVQHELSLTKGQLSKIYEVQSQFSKELQLDPQFPDLPAEERARFGKEWLAKMDVLADRLLPQIVAVLSSEQFQRLQQVNWQRMGSEALLDGELIKLLNFTEEQTARHASVIKKAAESLTNAKSRSIESKGIRAARDQSLLEILSDEQKKLFEDLKGKKIDLSTLASGQRSMVGRAKQTESDSRENRDRPTETIRKLIQSGSLDDAANEIESSFKSFESRSSADLRLQLAQKFIKAKRKKEAIVQATKAAEYLLPMITNRAVAKDGGGLAIHARSISRAAGLCSQAGNSKRADGWIEQALQSISSELTADAWSPIRPAYSDLLRTKAIRLVANKQSMHARELLDADASLAESLVCEHLGDPIIASHALYVLMGLLNVDCMSGASQSAKQTYGRFHAIAQTQLELRPDVMFLRSYHFFVLGLLPMINEQSFRANVIAESRSLLEASKKSLDGDSTMIETLIENYHRFSPE